MTLRSHSSGQRRRTLSWVWLVPVLAATLSVVVGYQAWCQRGTAITIDFRNASGIVAGQTQIRYRSAQIGSVEAVRLAEDRSHLRITARIDGTFAGWLTEGARFWIVQPRLGAEALSGFETLLTGPYIEFDPAGIAKTQPETRFTGLEQPPDIRAGEHGSVYLLQTERLGPLSAGSTVSFRDKPVGSVLDVDPPVADGPITLRIFIRAPYDGYVRAETRFWNSSGIRLDLGSTGLTLELESLRAALGGGIAFETPPDKLGGPAAPSGAAFPLLADRSVAAAADTAGRVEILTYFDEAIDGLGIGSPVDLQGLRVGTVTAVGLVHDARTRRFRVAVHLTVEPDRLLGSGSTRSEAERLLSGRAGERYRIALRTGNLLTGAKHLSIEHWNDAPEPDGPAAIAQAVEGSGAILLPSLPGTGNDPIAALSAVAGRIDALPLEAIGTQLVSALAAIDGLAGSARTLLRKADNGLGPAMAQLPQLMRAGAQSLNAVQALARSLEEGYGAESSFRRQTELGVRQAAEAAKALRRLAELLESHPEALIQGRRP